MRNALPDRIEDNLDDGMATCSAFNRRGTLLGNIQINTTSFMDREILCCFKRSVATMEGQLYGTLKHEASLKYWSGTYILLQPLGKQNARECNARSVLTRLTLVGLVMVARFSPHRRTGTYDYGTSLQPHLISTWPSTRQFYRRRSTLEAGKFLVVSCYPLV